MRILLIFIITLIYTLSAQGNEIGKKILSEIDTPKKLSKKLFKPMLNGSTKMRTFGENKEKGFNASVLNNSDPIFLELKCTRNQLGHLKELYIYLIKNNKKYTSYIPHSINAVCQNGFISCSTSRSENRNCKFFTWEVNNHKIKGVKSSFEDLLECFCIDNTCDIPKDKKATQDIINKIATSIANVACSHYDYFVSEIESTPFKASVKLVKLRETNNLKKLYKPHDDSNLSSEAKNKDNPLLTNLSQKKQQFNKNLDSEISAIHKQTKTSNIKNKGFNFILQDGNQYWCPISKISTTECEQCCKVSRPMLDTTVSSGGKSVNKYKYEIIYKPCVNGICPVDKENGEKMLIDCKCESDFNQAASMLELINSAGKDIICSNN